MYELERLHRQLMSEDQARLVIQQQWNALPDSHFKDILYGFALPLEIWLKGRPFYENPERSASTLPLFWNHPETTQPTWVDYLALLQ